MLGTKRPNGVNKVWLIYVLVKLGMGLGQLCITKGGVWLPDGGRELSPGFSWMTAQIDNQKWSHNKYGHIPSPTTTSWRLLPPISAYGRLWPPIATYGFLRTKNPGKFNCLLTSQHTHINFLQHFSQPLHWDTNWALTTASPPNIVMLAHLICKNVQV